MKLNFNNLAYILSCMTLVNANLVMIIRHGEKLNDEVTDLSPKGKARAHCLIDIFGNNGTYPTPQKIFAQSPSEKKQSTRPRDTVVPLAEALGLTVDLSYTSGQIKKLTNDIASSTENVVLISWSNDKILEIAEKLGIHNPPEWDKDAFDEIWMVNDNANSNNLNTNSNSFDDNSNNFDDHSNKYNANDNNINDNDYFKRAKYVGEESTMDIVKQNIDSCISQNIAKYSTLNSDNSSNAITNFKYSAYMMIISILFYVFVLF